MKNAIEIKNLSKSYKDFSLNNINLELPSGCVMGLIGKNGTGKSTIIKSILNIIRKKEGSITILGRDCSDTSLKNDIGIVFDEMGLPESFKLKQLNNILKGSFDNWDEKYFFELTEKFSLPAKKKFKQYSQGMKMKVKIAAALAHKPKLLVLDEATNGLDPSARDEILDVFNEFTREDDHSILISSHIVSDLEKICDYITFIDKGSVLLTEEKDRLYEDYGVIQCTEEQYSSLVEEAIVGKKKNAYGIDILMKRCDIPKGFEINPISIEELFVFMVKEEK